MKKTISASFLVALAVAMLLPVARQVNAASVDHSVLRQGSSPMPGSGGGGHAILRQGSSPMPGSGGGGHVILRQGSSPMPGSGGGGH
jgi:hypothetical protein